MIIPEYDNPDPRLSWEPLPCPWYLPSVKQYRFQIGGSSLGYKITTYRYSDGNILFNAASVMIAAGTVYGFTQSILWSVAIGIPLLVFITAFSWIQLRYMPHFDLPGRFFYRGIDRFEFKHGQFDQLPFDQIQALQIVSTGKKEHCQVIALLKDGSRKLLIHGAYRRILALIVFENREGKAVVSSEPSPCFLNAAAPIRDGAMFPLEYTPASQKMQTVSYKPSPGISLFAADDLAAFNRESLAHGFENAVRWADVCSKGTGFKAFPVCPDISMLEKWPERLNLAGIKTHMRMDDLYECISRSLLAGCRFDGMILTVEFNGYPVCLLLFIKLVFPDSGKVEACFYSENTELLEALKHAGLEEKS